MIQPIQSTKLVRVNRNVTTTTVWGKLAFDPAAPALFEDPSDLTFVDLPRGQATIETSSVQRTPDLLGGNDYHFFTYGNAFVSWNGGNSAWASATLINYAQLEAKGEPAANRAVRISWDFINPVFVGNGGVMRFSFNLFGKKFNYSYNPGNQPVDFFVDTFVPAKNVLPFDFGPNRPFDSVDDSDGGSFGAVSPVPEPSTWSLAVVGLFVGAGFVMRRRKLTPGEEWARAKLS
jgi:hypothetical protein